MSRGAPSSEEALRLATRRRIYEHLRDNPGCYERELQRDLGMGAGNLNYHLDFLEKAGLVISRLEDNYKRFFIAAQMPATQKALIALLRQQQPRRIVVWLLEHPRSAHRDVAAGVGMPPSSLAFHLRKLRKAEMVAQERVGRESFFWVAQPDDVVRVLVTYRASLLDTVVDRFLEAFLDVDHGYVRGVEEGEGPPQPGATQGDEAHDAEAAEPPDPEKASREGAAPAGSEEEEEEERPAARPPPPDEP